MENARSFVVPDSLAVSDSGFLFLASTGETFTLNLIGKEVFTMLKSGASLATIREDLQSAYDVDSSTVERDLDDFLNQLKTFKLVSVP
ncbi:MAG: PqqD family protein [Ignavibacteriae bacterium]|nr:PqqD family protein [Ignavibacteriota bacterium]